jgi:pSer/pThr/pTyr-binding forkhead associated (FHA) protein
VSGLRLRLQHTEIDLPNGEMVIGRAPTCRVRIDHPAISRRHARILVLDDLVEIEDLGSRNGVFVGGERVSGRHRLRVGDRIAIGNAEFQLVGPGDSPGLDPERTTGAIAIRRCPHCFRMFPSVLDRCPSCKGPAQSPRAEEEERISTHTDGSMHLLAGVGEKALAMGRVEEAERLIGRNLETVLSRVRGGERLDAPLFEDAVRRGVRLCVATKKQEWFAWVFDFAGAQGTLLPADAIDELHSLMFAQRPDVGPVLDGYIARLSSHTFRGDDQQLLKRITGLRRLTKTGE